MTLEWDLTAPSDDVRLASIIEAADPNVLRMALYQATRAPELTRLKVVKQAVRGGILIADVLAPEHHEEVRSAALKFLRKGGTVKSEVPSDADLRSLMQMSSGDPVEDKFFQFGKEELALDPFPRDVTWSHKPTAEVLERIHVVIVGCGISGISAAIHLQRLGIPFTIVERNPSVGGTWWLNQYPGCRVDTSSYLYQFKFEKNYPWSQHFATAEETLNYLKHLVTKYHLTPHIRLNSAVTKASWDESAAMWRIALKCAAGEEQIAANFLLSAVGVFHTPKVPHFKGADTFQGAMFHTAHWDYNFDHAGKRVGIIGNGSTGSQLMPEIAKTAAQLVHFQRTAQWIMPAENYGIPINPALRWMFDHFPYYWNWHCFGQFASAMKLQGIMVYDVEWRSRGGQINERNDKLREGLLKYIHGKVGTRPDLLNRLLPQFAPFGRRSVIDNGFYDALMRDNVLLESAGIDHFESDGIVTADGRKHQLDLIVLATGFEASKFLFPVEYRGINGVRQDDIWNKDGARAYLGMTMPGFPNFFMFWGPNGLPRNGGYYSWAEIWSRYILKAIVGTIERNARQIVLKRDVFDSYNDALDDEMKNILWGEEAKGSYYQNKYGRMDLAAPWVVEDVHAKLREPDFDDFELT